jgi:thiamine kinase-like enzyme
MPWPNPDDYNEALQCPELSFEDEDLRNGEVELTVLGLPKVASGNFACVYRMDCSGKSFAVKCFVRNVHDSHQRYAQLSQFVATSSLPHMVAFEYQLKGIMIDGNWYPIVKMDWVNGLGLDQFVRKNWSNKNEIERITRQFCEMVFSLQEVGVSHCDLQHGNILVKGDSVKLVDYDGMFVPAMAGQLSNELGHGNYQHLLRSEKEFGPNLDNFSAWIIYYSLFLLRLDSSLWQRHNGGDDCLLFRKADFANPQQSRLMNEIANHAIPDIRGQYQAIMQLLSAPLAHVPPFTGYMVDGQNLAQKSSLLSMNQAATASFNVSAVQAESKKKVERPVYPKIWPNSELYFASVIRPTKCFSDEKLANSVPVPTAGFTNSDLAVDANTQERLSSKQAIIPGRRNIVVRMVARDGSKQYAVKLFSQDLADRHQRYNAIHRMKKPRSSRYFVPFVYQPKGILVGEDWFPVLKMLWVYGVRLDEYVHLQLSNGFSEAVEELLPKLDAMVASLIADGIAHGDLEPANIIVDQQGELKIVDYDAMYIPDLASLSGCESGHPRYQHPGRNPAHFGPYLDSYSAIQIYGMLRCFSRHAAQRFGSWDSLLQQLGNPAIPEQQRSSGGQKAPRWLGEAAKGSQATGRFDPIFDKASSEDASTENSFDAARQRLSKVLKEQQRCRIDQVASLSTLLWRLY